MEEPIVFFGKKHKKGISKELAKNVDQSLAWENQNTSQYSPGIVKNTEIIARKIFSPIQIDVESGEIKTAAFDDVSNKGLSVNRLSQITENGIHEAGEIKANRDRESIPDRQYCGFIKASVNKIRKDLEGENRVFAVYDTALENDISHADVCMIQQGVMNNLPKSAANKERRRRLRENFGPLEIQTTKRSPISTNRFSLVFLFLLFVSLMFFWFS